MNRPVKREWLEPFRQQPELEAQAYEVGFVFIGCCGLKVHGAVTTALRRAKRPDPETGMSAITWM
jgi:hypothetical protein